MFGWSHRPHVGEGFLAMSEGRTGARTWGGQVMTASELSERPTGKSMQAPADLRHGCGAPAALRWEGGGGGGVRAP